MSKIYVCEHTFGEMESQEDYPYLHGVDVDQPNRIALVSDKEKNTFYVYDEEKDKIYFEGPLNKVLDRLSDSDLDGNEYIHKHVDCEES
jgi:hypothetical protein